MAASHPCVSCQGMGEKENRPAWLLQTWHRTCQIAAPEREGRSKASMPINTPIPRAVLRAKERRTGPPGARPTSRCRATAGCDASAWGSAQQAPTTEAAVPMLRTTRVACMHRVARTRKQAKRIVLGIDHEYIHDHSKVGRPCCTAVRERDAPSGRPRPRAPRHRDRPAYPRSPRRGTLLMWTGDVSTRRDVDEMTPRQRGGSYRARSW